MSVHKSRDGDLHREDAKPVTITSLLPWLVQANWSMEILVKPSLCIPFLRFAVQEEDYTWDR